MQSVIQEIFKPARKNFPRRPVIMTGLNDLWQADLADLKNYSRENSGFRYILVIINCFTKFAYAVPIRTKSDENVASAFASIFKEHKAPENLQVDKGTEFYNKECKKLFKKYNINLYSTHSGLKATIVERFISTLKDKMWKLFALQGNYNYTKILSKIIDEYNNTKHRTIKMKSKDVTEKHEKLLLKTVYNYKNNNEKFKFKVGDKVRISKFKHLFSKSYTPNYTTEIFTIRKVQPPFPPTYLLEDYKKNPLEGGFYEQELLKS